MYKIDNTDLLYSTGNYVQYLAITFNGKESEKVYTHTHTHTHTYIYTSWYMPASQVAPVVKNLPANAEDVRDAGSIPGSGRSPRGGYGNPLQSSCLESPMDRGATGPQCVGSHGVGHDLRDSARSKEEGQQCL